jgi:hypothetical protein
MKIVVASSLLLLTCACVPIEQRDKPPIPKTSMNCGIKDGVQKCWTDSAEYDVGTWDGTTGAFTFHTPIPWFMIGGFKGVYSGQEIYDVTVTAHTTTTLVCQWHTEGSHKIGGGGGYVRGYCEALAARYIQ